MEKVWGELKKIEAQAEQIRGEAQQKAQSIAALAQQNGEKLVANSQVYADQESQQLFASTVEDANSKRDEQLRANEATTGKLKTQAEKNMDAAIAKVVDAVIQEAKA